MRSTVSRPLGKFVGLFRRTQPSDFTPSYSQEGEDIILRRIFERQNSGFYVDVGAHHPTRFSNTYLFYLHGWRGMNIDAAPGCMEAFRKLRPHDINLEVAVSRQREILTYYEFDDPALNSFSPEVAHEHAGFEHHWIRQEIKLQTYPLSEIFEQYLPPEQSIDFLNVDVEGLDFQVLSSNDWSKFRPRIVLAEDLSIRSLDEVDCSEVSVFMRSQDYHLLCKTIHTLIFRDGSGVITDPV